MTIVRDPLDPRVSHWHFLAYMLRWERERHALSLAQWGQIIGAARSTVSNIEAGRRKIDDRQAIMIDTRFNTGSLYELLLWYARNGHDPDWAKEIAGYEAVARVFRVYESQHIPLPFQTEAYARALISAGSLPDVEAAVTARMRRQETLLERPNPPYVWSVIDEHVLDEQFGGTAVIREQLQHLVALAERPQVSVRVIPRSTPHAGLDGSFRIISIDSRDIAYAGARRGGRLIEMPGEVADFRLDFDKVGLKAASEAASLLLIRQRLEAIG